MPVQTRIYTNHTITSPGSALKADMMLDDQGHGTITLASAEGPILTIDAARAESVAGLMQECIGLRDLMGQTGDEMITGPADRPTLI